MAQATDAIRWVPNGPVYAVARRDGVTYVGGDFTIVSPPSGAGRPINIANGVVPGGFPQVVGRVLTVLGDGAGGWYIGGEFTIVGGLQRNNIAHVASDFTLTSWNPNANGPVRALFLTQAGTLYAGGDFTVIGGQVRTRLAELDVNTGNATALNIAMDGPVRALSASGSTMYVGGDFTHADLSARGGLCAIDIASRLLTAWSPPANGPVYALEFALRPPSSPAILIGGSFTTINGFPRQNLAAVLPTGMMTTWNPSPDGAVRRIQAQTVAYIGGEFTHIGGQPRNHLAAVDLLAATVTSWDPNVDGPVETLVWSNNLVFVGGTFSNVGGQPRRNVAKIDETTGIAAAWDPKPNNTVKALAVGLTQIFAGGEFTGFGGVARRNLCAFDDWTHNVTAWDPQADAPVRALALRAFGPVVYAVYAGGDFLNISGQPRAHLAALHPKTGVPTSWITNTNQAVRALAVNDTLVAFGGDFTSTNGEATAFVSARRHSGGSLIHLEGLPVGNVLALGMSPGFPGLEVGGDFGLGRFDLANHTGPFLQSPAPNGAVRAILQRGDTFYIGGDFTTFAGQPRARLAKLTSTTVLSGWNPGADDTVRALAQGELGLLVGGDFLNAANLPRMHVAQIDQVTGAAIPWVANAATGEVYAISSKAAQVDLGGTFRGIIPLPSAGYAVVGPDPLQLCGAPLATPAGGRPRALAVLDANADGIEDLAVCEDGGATAHVLLLRGNGTGQFTLVQTIDAPTTPMAVTAVDFDRDGQMDLAVSESDTVGVIVLLHNVGGTFQSWTTVPLPGRSEGLAAGDYDADGIVDLVACLVDSASTPKRGGLELIKGGGTNGTWDGTFALVARHPVGPWAASARRVVAHDFNQDGFTDFFYMGTAATTPLFVSLDPGFTSSCENVTADFVDPADGFAIAYGDFNEDGRSDIVYASARRLFLRYKNDLMTCGNWFTQFDQVLVPLASTPRDLAVMDVDRDGILDVVCAFDSLSTLMVYPGGGTGGVPDGTFRLPVTLETHDVWALGIGDFVSDGITDVVTSMATCGYVSTWQNGASPLFPMTITLDSPNGGESLAQTPPPQPVEASVVALEEDERAASAPSKVASLRTISWTKGAGVHGVDVELSRNDGTTWETIGSNMPGTTMTWYSTPPPSSLARVRVRDAPYRGTMDASDAPFSIIAGLIGTVPPGAPLLPRLALVGQHPAHGAVRFLLDVPAPADVAVVLYDAAGRTVRTLARGRYVPGSHDLAWDGKDDRGEGCRRGVYFVRTRIGAFEDRRKVVML